MDADEPSPRTRGRRLRERLAYEREAIAEILDEALICHVGFDSDGPLVLPMIHARVGDVMYLHLSSGSGLALAAAGESQVEVCATATIVDGLVMAKSQFHHSLNYRSVVVRGSARVVTDPGERDTALRAIVDHISPGRSGRSRPANARESAATAVLRLPLAEASAKVRTGPPADDDEDLTLPHWAGIVPVRVTAGEPLATDAADAAPALAPRFLSRSHPGEEGSAPGR